MRIILLLIITLLNGCDLLWIPECRIHTDANGCQVDYRPTPDYSTTYSNQTWFLKAMNQSDNLSFKLADYQKEIKAKFDLNQAAQLRSYELEIQEIDDKNSIVVSHNSEKNIAEKTASLSFQFGAGSPFSINLKTVDLGCYPTGSYTKLLGAVGETTTSWVGLRTVLGKTTFLTSEIFATQSVGTLSEYTLNAPTNSIPDVPLLDPSCQAIATRSFSLQYCATASSANLHTWNENIKTVPPRKCVPTAALDNSLYCNFNRNPQIHASGENDIVLIFDGSQMTTLILTKNGSNSVQVENLIQNLGAEPSIVNFLHIGNPNFVDFLSYSQDGNLSIYIQNENNQFVYNSDFSGAFQRALGQINSNDPRPVDAMAAGDLLGDQSMKLLVAKGSDLWLIDVDLASGSSPSAPAGLPQRGLAVLRNVFPESPVRLELGDFDGNGRLDLAYVGRSAAYLCLTHVDGG